MQHDGLKFVERARVLKLNNEEDNGSMSQDGIKWSCKAKIYKYYNDEDYKNNKPYEVRDVIGNTAFYGGLNLLWQIVMGTNTRYINANNSFLGVGNSTAAANPDQTSLLGSSQLYKGMDQSTGINYPLLTDNIITFRAKFGPTEANFAWNEWGISDGNPTTNPNYIQLNRKVEAMGTKEVGSTWVLVSDIAFLP